MAAQINGYTLHHWSRIPVRNNEAAGTGDRHKQSIKCQALRVLIFDEVSMISAELYGALDYVVTTAVRVPGTYKKDAMGVRVILAASMSSCGQIGRSYMQYQAPTSALILSSFQHAELKML